MEKYDISQKITFKTGSYELNSDANFNFQLNRVIMWDGGDADEVAAVSQNIKTSSDWVKIVSKNVLFRGRIKHKIVGIHLERHIYIYPMVLKNNSIMKIYH